MDQPNPSHGRGSAARRRLIRGALAAPAVLTVASGSAFASASTRCLANAVADPVTVDPSDAMDGYVRVPLFVQVNEGTSTKYFLKGFEATKVAFGADLPVGDGKWREFDVVNNVLVGVDVDNLNLTDVGKYAGVRYNAEGLIVGVGEGEVGSMVGTSCWNSFAAAAIA